MTPETAQPTATEIIATNILYNNLRKNRITLPQLREAVAAIAADPRTADLPDLYEFIEGGADGFYERYAAGMPSTTMAGLEWATQELDLQAAALCNAIRWYRRSGRNDDTESAVSFGTTTIEYSRGNHLAQATIDYVDAVTSVYISAQRELAP